MEIFDTHAHILDKVYDEVALSPLSDGEHQIRTRRDEILARAARENFYIIESALNDVEWEQVVRLASETENKNLFFTIGIHPHDATKYAGDDKKISVLIKRMKDIFISNKNRCLAIGEMGLDYHYKNSLPSDQKKIFKAQIELALSELSAPVVIHCRDAYEDCFEILKSYSDRWRGVIHCFSGGVNEAEKFLSLGFCLGITCPVTYPKSEKLKKVVAFAPTERLLAETDSPYLPPSHLRGKVNEPANVRFVIEEIARIKGISFEDAANATSVNARRLFGIESKR